MALAEKGVPTSCDQEPGDGGQPQQTPSTITRVNGESLELAVSESNGTQPSMTDSHDILVDEDGGIDL